MICKFTSKQHTIYLGHTKLKAFNSLLAFLPSFQFITETRMYSYILPHTCLLCVSLLKAFIGKISHEMHTLESN